MTESELLRTGQQLQVVVYIPCCCCSVHPLLLLLLLLLCPISLSCQARPFGPRDTILWAPMHADL